MTSIDRLASLIHQLASGSEELKVSNDSLLSCRYYRATLRIARIIDKHLKSCNKSLSDAIFRTLRPIQQFTRFQLTERVARLLYDS